MAYEQKENTGSMFVNEKKEKETHPDRTGSALIGGVEYWVSGWIKDGKNGKWMSLSFQQKVAKPQEKKPDPARHFDDMKDNIPF